MIERSLWPSRRACVGLIAVAFIGCEKRNDELSSAEAVESSKSQPASASPSVLITVAKGVDSAAPSPSAAPARPVLPLEDGASSNLKEQREQTLTRMTVVLGLSDDVTSKVRAILEKSDVMGQGNPELSSYAMTRAECRARREAAGVNDGDVPICRAPLMVPVPAAGETRESAKLCIDRYEFPNVPCEYPWVWMTGQEAMQLCAAVGKRLCDAHEWEGACAGELRPVESEYGFGRPRRAMKESHNASRERIWAYGPTRDLSICAHGSKKSDSCKPSGYRKCGTNSYPAGSFPECKSALGVYDQHGNVAEHMSLPLRLEDLGRNGGSGETEMKGSWFAFGRFDAHPDDCRWRAPDWHVAKVKSPSSHLNYHLGFRCCKDVSP